MEDLVVYRSAQFWFRPKPLLTVLTAFLILFILLTAYFLRHHQERVNLNELRSVAQMQKVNEAVQLQQFELKVSNVQDAGGRVSITPIEGNVWKNVYIEMHNTGEDDKAVSLQDIYLVDDKGFKYYQTTTDMTNRNSPRFDLQADLPKGAIMNGWVGFSVPNNAQGLQLVYVVAQPEAKTYMVAL